MIDESFNVYLIEANINPCLGVTSAFSSRFINNLIDNTMRISIDPLFPPPQDFSGRKLSCDILPEMKYELIFDQKTDGDPLDELYKEKKLDETTKGIWNELNAEKDSRDEIMEVDYPDEEDDYE